MGQYPYPKDAQVEKQGGDVLGTLVVDVWPLGSSRQTSTGEQYDWEGLAPLEYADVDIEALLTGSNRHLVVEGKRFRVIAATGADLILPHLELRLLAAGAAGGGSAR